MKKSFCTLIISFLGYFELMGQGITLTANSSLNQVSVRGYGANVPNFSGLRSLGTPAAPTAVLANTPLAVIYGDGYNGSAFSNNGALIALNANENFTSIANGTNIEFYTTNNGNVSPNKRLIVTHNGRVGIGTDVPASLLEVKTSTANYGVQQTDGTVTVGTYVSSSTGGWIGTRSNHPLSLFVNNGNASLQVNTAGNTSIGKLATHSYKLEIHPTVAENCLAVYNSNDTHRWGFFVDESNSRLILDVDGSRAAFVNYVTGALSFTSDRRLKKNIIPLENVMNKVLQLKPSNYQYISNNPFGKVSTGFIAQEVEPLFPQFVGTAVDKVGNQTKTMDYSSMSAISLKAIQEQQEIIINLQSLIENLKTENASLITEKNAFEDRLNKLENLVSRINESKKTVGEK
jgi:hypothetical protein